jgi:hypothetical protein
MQGRLRRRTVYLATVAAMIAMVGGWALAVSTTNTGPAEGTNVTVTAPGGFTTASVLSTQVVAVSSLIAAYTSAGTQNPSTSGASGTTLVLATCASGPCTENHQTVNGNALVAGDYAQQVLVQVTQPATGGAASGFDFQVEESINSGTLVFGYAYFSTGVSSAGSAQMINVYVFFDLGTSTAPTVGSISVSFNNCQTASTCP